MKLSFEGVRGNALRELRAIENLALRHEDYDEDEHTSWAIKTCISAYHDCLLALMRGDVDVNEIKEFLLAYKTPEEIAAIAYCGEVVMFKKSEAA